MTNSKLNLIYRLQHRIRLLPINLHQRLRVWKYKLLSNIYQLKNLASFNQPTLLIGHGSVNLGRCNLGVWPSPYYLNGYIHIEARATTATVEIEDGVWINNNAVIICDRTRIRIGANSLIGTDFTVYDSDFHDLHPERRMAGTHKCEPVNIGKNVFIGSRVLVLRGVNIGDNSVIASGSIVTKSIPANCVAGGAPAIFIKNIETK